MKTGDNGLNLIKKFEGLRLASYQDSVGVWTIGYGHTQGVKSGMVITNQEAENLLKTDLAKVENAINAYNFKLNQNQFDALVSLFFNVGTGYLKNFVTLLRTNPDSDQVPAKINLYVYAGGGILSGLVKRRKAEAELYKKKL